MSSYVILEVLINQPRVRRPLSDYYVRSIQLVVLGFSSTTAEPVLKDSTHKGNSRIDAMRLPTGPEKETFLSKAHLLGETARAMDR
jgi:hypothetical protein